MMDRAGGQLRAASRRLMDAGIDSPLLDAQIMLARVLGCSRLDLIAHPERLLTDSESADYAGMLERRVARWPLAYVVGRIEFYGLEIEVAEGVLVPRPETELLVDECIRRVRADHPMIADIGTGSGAIAVAVAVRTPSAMVYAVDISEKALKVARANIEKQDLSGRVTLLTGDMLAPLAGMSFDAILSNPPYIATEDIPGLQPEIAMYEPREALDGGPDGLDAYRLLLPGSISLLREGGFVAVEVGAGQAGAVGKIAEASGYSGLDVVKDLGGIERVVVAVR